MVQQASATPQLTPAILANIRRALLSDIEVWQLVGLRHVPWVSACVLGCIVHVLTLTSTWCAAFMGCVVGMHLGLRSWLAQRPAFRELERFNCCPLGYNSLDQRVQAYWCDRRRRRDLLESMRRAIGTTQTRVGMAMGYGALASGFLRTM